MSRLKWLRESMWRTVAKENKCLDSGNTPNSKDWKEKLVVFMRGFERVNSALSTTVKTTKPRSVLGVLRRKDC